MGVARELIRKVSSEEAPAVSYFRAGSDKGSLIVGAKVEARFRNGSEFFSGKIIHVNTFNECFVILYDDGDKEDNVPATHIRLCSTDTSSNDFRLDMVSLRVGSRVEAKFRGHDLFYPGVVSRCGDDGTFDIVYDDGDTESSVSSSFIRSLCDDIVNSTDGTSQFDDARRERVQKGLRKGQSIQAKFKGHSEDWREGKITKVRKDGSLDVHFNRIHEQ